MVQTRIRCTWCFSTTDWITILDRISWSPSSPVFHTEKVVIKGLQLQYLENSIKNSCTYREIDSKIIHSMVWKFNPFYLRSMLISRSSDTLSSFLFNLLIKCLLLTSHLFVSSSWQFHPVFHDHTFRFSNMLFSNSWETMTCCFNQEKMCTKSTALQVGKTMYRI